MKGFGNKVNIKNIKKSKLIHKKLIDRALQLHLQGKINEASKCYKDCIDKGVLDAGVFSNYGLILRGLGQLEDAEKYTRKAIKLNADLANPHANLGSILRDLGKLEEAEISLRKAVQLNPDFANAYSNLGSVLRDLGKLDEAEIHTRKSIQLDPSLSVAYFNLGSILRDLGKLKEAEIQTRKSIELNPNFAMAYSNLGSMLRDFGRLEEAEIEIRKAIKLDPFLSVAYSNLGSLLRDSGRLKEAEIQTRKAIQIEPSLSMAQFNLGTILYEIDQSELALDCYLKVISVNTNESQIYQSISELLRMVDLSKLDKSKLNFILDHLLEKDNISHHDLFHLFNYLYKKELKDLLTTKKNSSNIDYLENNKIIRKAFKKIIFRDKELEKLLTKFRKDICQNIKNNENTDNYDFQLIISLAEQCFLNEYVYQTTQEESEYMSEIINDFKKDLIDERKIALLACYFPLHKIIKQIPLLKLYKTSDENLKALINLQLIEPLEELELSRNIRTLGKIRNSISLKVKSQYEQNPYPRWRYIYNAGNYQKSIYQSINDDIIPNFISGTQIKNTIQVLIAGCGTGKQIMQAQRYRNAKLTAIDLSLSSLAYASRKLNEFEMSNVELVQMDILDVELLEEKFDVIECGGVLHHMENPEKGLRVLLKNLKHDGFLKLGLYSEIARQSILLARDYIRKNKIDQNEINIRDFREKVISGELDNLQSLTSFDDFYSYSECRDLCFHEKEHQFTILKLKEILKNNNLRFLGFLLSPPIKNSYNKQFPEDKKCTNLDNWELFEEKNPHTFKGMYQFWSCKILS